MTKRELSKMSWSSLDKYMRKNDLDFAVAVYGNLIYIFSRKPVADGSFDAEMCGLKSYIISYSAREFIEVAKMPKCEVPEIKKTLT